MPFIQLARGEEMRAQMNEICAQQPCLDPKTWDSRGELDSEEAGRRADMIEYALQVQL